MTGPEGWPDQPVIHEIDTWVWLTDLERRFERPMTLADVPPAVWDEVCLAGFDAVWLMGVWERSPAGLEIALRDGELRQTFRAALPDVRLDDVVGSPYCVRSYSVDSRLGGPDGLAAARRALADRGVRLILDYVPNHVAPDHLWARTRPGLFVDGTDADLAAKPEAFMEVGGRVIARGRDPFFPPWPDVLQLNAFKPELRQATADVLSSIGAQCDGVRCDMAMLMLTDVFARTWGDRAGPAPAEPFWPEVLGQVRQRHPGLLLIAEAYWDREWALLQQGFDYCYDKRLYDRLVEGSAEGIRTHLQAGLDYQRHLLRFIENHDEPRAASVLGPPQRQRAATVAIATLPGGTLWHEGQFDSRRIRVPVFLGRRPAEKPDPGNRRFTESLLHVVQASGLRSGDWQLLSTVGWPDNPSHQDLVAWAWERGAKRHVVVINLAAHPGQARIPLPWPDLRGRRQWLRDLLSGVPFDRDGDELVDPGLFVDLPPWGWHLLALEGSS